MKERLKEESKNWGVWSIWYTVSREIFDLAVAERRGRGAWISAVDPCFY